MNTLPRSVASASRKHFIAACLNQQNRHIWSLNSKDQRSKYGAKVRAAESEWEEKAKKIRSGEKESMLSILESRGYVNAIAGDGNELDTILTDRRVGVYVGIDPTAPSVHLGHLIPMMALLHMYIEGFEAVHVLGGATGSIGDPTGRLTSRPEYERKMRRAHLASMHTQLRRLWPRMEQHAISAHKYEKTWSWRRALLNNSEWMNKVTLMEFLKTIGKDSRVGTMLSRDTARTKLEKGDGLSFAELSYPLLQSWDWWHLFKSRAISMQIGGSDQFGNIISGIDSINHLRKQSETDPTVRPEILSYKPVGITTPLLTTAAGEKFGKSAGNAVWLDEDMTSPFELYQFLLRSADADVERYLKLFTLIPLPEISTLMDAHNTDPSKRVAQRRLAQEVVTMVHTKDALRAIESENSVLFRQPKKQQSSSTPTDQQARTAEYVNPSMNPTAPQTSAFNATGTRITLPRSLVENQAIARVLYSAGLVASRSEGHRLAQARGAYIGSQPSKVGEMGDSLKFAAVDNWPPEQTWKYVLDDSLLILRVGKWKVRIITIVSDEEFDKQGLDAPPGWVEFKQDREKRHQGTSEVEGTRN